MPARGKCPNPDCRETLDTAEAEEITITAGALHIAGVSFVCPKCRTVVSVEVNPWYAKAFADSLEKPEGNGA
jgi:hypothetical protein